MFLTTCPITASRSTDCSTQRDREQRSCGRRSWFLYVERSADEWMQNEDDDAQRQMISVCTTRSGTYTYIQAYIHRHIHTGTHRQAHTYTHTHIHTHTHTHLHACRPSVQEPASYTFDTVYVTTQLCNVTVWDWNISTSNIKPLFY